MSGSNKDQRYIGQVGIPHTNKNYQKFYNTILVLFPSI
jgi:hypothetical protein